jgi:regulator of replication initiation timing
MDAQETINEVIEEIQEQLEELIDENEKPEILELKLMKLREKAQEFIYDFQRETEALELIETN